MLLRLHILRRSLELKKECKDITGTLNEALKLPYLKDTKVIFTWLLDGFSNRPGAMSVCRGLIAVNAEWAARLVLFDDEEVKEAFMFTMGHEMTHQAGDCSFFGLSGKEKRFVNWVGEVHADFGGAELAFDGKVSKALTAVRYRANQRKSDKDSQAHPSWKRREEYLSYKRFDKELIERIAGDTGCDNGELIGKVSEFYSPIILEE